MRSRKILAFVVVVLGVLALVTVTTKLGTPNEVATNALWIVGFSGFFTIGGQSLVDAISKSRWSANGHAEKPKEP
jgi:hypothetical protein